MENSREVPLKTKNRAKNTNMIQQSRSWAYIQKKKKENSNSKRCMHPNVHSDTIYEDMEAT